METKRPHIPPSNTPSTHESTVNDVVSDSVKLAHELYQEGLNKWRGASDEAAACSDALLEKVREHPLKALLIAGGVGILLSTLLRK